MLAEVLPHVAHVHVKDAEGSTDHPVYTMPGAGQARVADCLRLLLRSGYTGVWSIEPHLHLRPHEPVPAAGHGEAARQDRQDGFVASGMALEALVRDAVLPAVPAWRAVPGGLRHA
jgi:sugar phosphate isomerase/epimerase